VKDHVFVLGYRDDVPEILAGSGCCVDASYAGLGVAGTLREALAVETPVIASDLEGNPELVRDGQTGILFPARDVPALAAAMVAAKFSTPAKLKATEDLYRRLLEGPSP